jgi:hypothetical protein
MAIRKEHLPTGRGARPNNTPSPAFFYLRAGAIPAAAGAPLAPTATSAAGRQNEYLKVGTAAALGRARLGRLNNDTTKLARPTSLLSQRY